MKRGVMLGRIARRSDAEILELALSRWPSPNARK